MRLPLSHLIPLILPDAASRDASREDIRDQAFPKQDLFVQDDSRFVSALCTRRAGKSNGLALKFFRAGLKHPRAFLPYIALTRDSARNIMWPVLEDMNDRFGLGAEMLESKLACLLPNGSIIKLFGADMKGFIRRLKGTKSPFVAVDEAQDFGSHIEQLIDDVLTPTISDYPDGQIALTGTPGPVPHGYFYDVTELRKFGFSRHEWSVFDNPYMPNARAFVEDLKKKKQWAETSPTYLREWCGKWVLDLDALVFKYLAARNDYRELPHQISDMVFVLGVDLGLRDSDAICALGWHPHHRKVYLVEERLEAGQGITELAGQIESFIKRYNPMKVVMDTGGLGAKIAQELNSRYSLPVQAADKNRKFEFIELLNDAMRTSQFFARSDSRFAQDCSRVKWDLDSDKLKVADGFHSDICDSVLYAFRESLHWLSQAPAAVPAPGTPAWLERQEQEMEELAEKSLRSDQELDIFGEIGWNSF